MSVGSTDGSSQLKLMCALAVRAPFDKVIVPDFEAGGPSVVITWNPTTVIMKHIAEGQRADAVLLISDSMDALAEQGIVDPATRVEVVESRLGVAVAGGAPHPDITSADAFRQSLLDARSVAYSQGGASGIYFKALIERLGITAAINAKATIIPAGFTAEKLTTGEADIAIQQISELLVVPGIEIVGPFPAALQKVTAISGAIFKDAPNKAAAQRFLGTLLSDRAVAAYRDTGLDLPGA